MATRYGGVDLGGTKIQAVVVDEHHEVLGSSRHPTPTTGGPADVALAIVGAMREASEEAGVGPGELTALGVGSPGVVDADGTVTSARNLPDWEGSYPLAAKLEAALAAPVAISNDVNVATQAEFELGAAQPFQSLLGVFWATALERDDKLAHRLIDQAVEALGVGIASALNLLDVEAVVIGGGLGLRLGEPYVERIREAMLPHLFASENPPAVELAALGDLGGAIG